MKPFYGVYPDAVMSINHDGNKPIFGIEYENNIQNVSKYQSKIEKYLKKMESQPFFCGKSRQIYWKFKDRLRRN